MRMMLLALLLATSMIVATLTPVFAGSVDPPTDRVDCTDIPPDPDPNPRGLLIVPGTPVSPDDCKSLGCA